MRRTHCERLVHDRNGQPIVMANLVMNVCSECGQESMPLDSARIVEGAIQGEMAPTGRFSAPMYEVA